MPNETIPILYVHIDGACEPINPGGTAAYAFTVQDNNPNLICSKFGIVGSGEGMSNNVAEYAALIYFLEWYISTSQSAHVILYSDSQLVVMQMDNKWKVKGGLYLSYYLKAKQLLSTSAISIEFKWIPREANIFADNLTKKAIEEYSLRKS